MPWVLGNSSVITLDLNIYAAGGVVPFVIRDAPICRKTILSTFAFHNSEFNAASSAHPGDIRTVSRFQLLHESHPLCFLGLLYCYPRVSSDATSSSQLPTERNTMVFCFQYSTQNAGGEHMDRAAKGRIRRGDYSTSDSSDMVSPRRQRAGTCASKHTTLRCFSRVCVPALAPAAASLALSLFLITKGDLRFRCYVGPSNYWRIGANLDIMDVVCVPELLQTHLLFMSQAHALRLLGLLRLTALVYSGKPESAMTAWPDLKHGPRVCFFVQMEEKEVFCFREIASPRNIIICNGRIVGVVDWELAGCFLHKRKSSWQNAFFGDSIMNQEVFHAVGVEFCDIKVRYL
ncbi:hypothetical protein PAAG_03357 [Paracoccidioides lutzii Pb01]|uniref:Aminoglycoside phosphotransferase domain-containing protein n=1 Tax=Paracoccidioides lutzii (strain ATCC MYA-826 / Pb01) TaxID=502779 RepID=C1GWY3_PARBA|nr:hypothetical protein PAAG_03357 [Paracoccidioides lutzii Pb01]EEH41071.2 hypothetical protein PAAG_03357 [Paracoccidioides lutzii Pb01]